MFGHDTKRGFEVTFNALCRTKLPTVKIGVKENVNYVWTSDLMYYRSRTAYIKQLLIYLDYVFNVLYMCTYV